METRASKRSMLLRRQENEYKDRISDLSDALSHHILSFLPIKSIAQTSLLSKRWQYLWSSFPSLDFSDSEIGHRIGGLSIKPLHYLETKAFEFITLLLSRRHNNSTIKTFRLTGDLNSSCLYNCIRSVVKHKVLELELDVTLCYRFDIPRCLLSCDSLRVLTLKARKRSTTLEKNNNKKKKQNSNFGFLTSYVIAASGLRSLRSLSLTCIYFTDNPLVTDLFSGSRFPLLKKLNLCECEGMTHLRISCPNLEDLTVCNMQINGLEVSGRRLERLQVKCCFHNCSEESWVEIFAPRLHTFLWEHSGITAKFSLQNFPFLFRAGIYLLPFCAESAVRIQSAASLLSGLSNAQKLYIGFQFIEILSEIHSAHILPYSFDNLNALVIHTGLNKCDIPGVAGLLRSSPKLQALKIMIINGVPPTENLWNRDFVGIAGLSEEECWESRTTQGFTRLSLRHLAVVKVIVRGTMIHENAINLVKFLLKHGSVLQKMSLCSENGDNENPPLWQQISGSIKEFSRASRDVDIIL